MLLFVEGGCVHHWLVLGAVSCTQVHSWLLMATAHHQCGREMGVSPTQCLGGNTEYLFRD